MSSETDKIPDKAFPVLQCLLDVLKQVAEHPPVPEHPNSGEDGFDDNARLMILEKIGQCFCRHDLEQTPATQSQVLEAVENIFAPVCDLLQSLPGQDYQRKAIQSNLLELQRYFHTRERNQRHLESPKPVPKTETQMVDNLDDSVLLPPSDKHQKRRKSSNAPNRLTRQASRRRQSFQANEEQRTGRGASRSGRLKVSLRPEVHGIGATARENINNLLKRQEKPRTFERSKPTASFMEPPGLPAHSERTLPKYIKSSTIATYLETRSTSSTQIVFHSPTCEIAQQCPSSPMEITEEAQDDTHSSKTPPGTQSASPMTNLSSYSLGRTPVASPMTPVTTIRSPAIIQSSIGSPCASYNTSKPPNKHQQYRISKPYQGSPVHSQASPTLKSKRHPLSEHPVNRLSGHTINSFPARSVDDLGSRL